MKPNYTITPGALDGVEAFLRVAARGSFRQAADDLGVTPSAISQAIRALESRLGVPLFVRTTRSVGLTQAGERFLDGARPGFERIVAAGELARELAQRPSGLLRIAAPRSVVPLLLQPVLASFTQAYPEIVVEIAASEELVDLARDGFDAGIRLGEFIAADMVAVRLSPPLRYAMVGSPGYLDRSGRPLTTEDLRHHSCIRLRRASGALAPWNVRLDEHDIEVAVRGSLVVSDFATMLAAALGGSGLAQLPEPVAREDLRCGRLEEVLPAFTATTPGVFLYYANRQQVLPKLRVFIEHLRSVANAARDLQGVAAAVVLPDSPRLT